MSVVDRGPRRDKGQSLVEVALALPVFLLLLMALFDFGRVIYAYNTVSEAARNGARVAIVNQTYADICQVAAGRAVALGLPTTCALSATVVGVYVLPATRCSEINCIQSVKVTYQFDAITPLIGTVVGPITVSSTSKVPVERVCYNAGGSCPKP